MSVSHVYISHSSWQSPVLRNPEKMLLETRKGGLSYWPYFHSFFFFPYLVAYVDKTITKPTVSPQRGKT